MVAAVAALALAGCASGTRKAAIVFLGEHAAGATRAAAATKAVEAEVSQLPSSPTRSQLERLSSAVGHGRRSTVQVGEWNVGEASVAEGSEEEDLPRAEAQVTEGANELADAMSARRSSVRAPRAGALARYRSELAHGREQWNEGISQLWFLAGRSNPPTV